MRLVEDWKCVLLRAWSVRLALLAAGLSGAEVACSVLTSSPPVSPGLFAAVSGLVTVAAAVARLVAQTTVSGGEA